MKKREILLDTCAWLWLSANDKRIGKNVIARLPEVWLVSAISVWEVSVLVRKKRIALSYPLREWVHMNLREAPHIKLIPLEPDISVTSMELKNCLLKDPADRIILATALEENVPLITGDKKMISYAKKSKIDVVKV